MKGETVLIINTRPGQRLMQDADVCEYNLKPRKIFIEIFIHLILFDSKIICE